MVTPLAQAAADQDHRQESALVASTAIPIILLAALALCITLPLVAILSPKLLFGASASVASPQVLRTAALLACVGTLVSVPLSIIENIRQAYQETHIGNLFGASSNAALCVGLLLAAWLAPELTSFVAVTVFVPLAVRLLNALFLFAGRPYLLAMYKEWRFRSHVGSLAADGASYMAGGFVANAMVFQWPIYYMARTRSPLESSTFAVSLQFIILVLSLFFTVAQPLWPAVADAVTRADRIWLLGAVRSARLLTLAYGAAAMLLLGSTMNAIISLWLHRPFHVTNTACWLFGCYVLLDVWEYVHWPILLGLGAIRPASIVMFLRALAFAAFVPFAARYGLPGVAALFCASVVAVSAWWFPRLLSSRVRMVWESA